jgi:poly-gamma-glutamate capsule biosynthesis protein CapA/YwtB (metallophosphatase superfamily)
MTAERLILVGDVAMQDNDPEVMFREVAEYVTESAIAFGNCEWSMSDRGAPWAGKSGLICRTSPSQVRAYTHAGFKAVGLATNHMLDYGTDGLMQTIEVLDAAGIGHCGGGSNEQEAHQPAIIEAQGLRVAFLSYTSVFTPGWEAAPDRAGLAVVRVETAYRPPRRGDEMPGSPFAVVNTPDGQHVRQLVDDIASAREQADAVIVSWHWGVSLGYQHLVPYQVELGHRAIDAGADLVLGHHPHLLQGIEVYRGKVIAYSVGHFGFDLGFEMATAAYSQDESVLLECELRPGLGEVKVRPVLNSGHQPRIVGLEDGRTCVDWLARISRPLGTDFRRDGDAIVPVART